MAGGCLRTTLISIHQSCWVLAISEFPQILVDAMS